MNPIDYDILISSETGEVVGIINDVDLYYQSLLIDCGGGEYFACKISDERYDIVEVGDTVTDTKNNVIGTVTDIIKRIGHNMRYEGTSIDISNGSRYDMAYSNGFKFIKKEGA